MGAGATVFVVVLGAAAKIVSGSGGWVVEEAIIGFREAVTSSMSAAGLAT